MIARSKFSSVKALFARMARDERGGELVEWVLVVGLIAVICLIAIGGLGSTLGIRWNDVLNVM